MIYLLFLLQTIFLPIAHLADSPPHYYIAHAGIGADTWHQAENVAFDDAGIPMVQYAGEWVYNPGTIVQYGLALWNDHLFGADSLDEFRHVVAYLAGHYEERNGGAAYPYNYFLLGYNLQPGWVSSMTQGQMLSLLQRAYLLDADPSYLDLARKVERVLMMPVRAGGTAAQTPEGGVWLEGASTITPSLILNDHMFAVIGLYDYGQMTGEWGDYQAALKSLGQSVGFYDDDHWLIYDRAYRVRVHPSYISIHVRLANHLAEITGDSFYGGLAAKWATYKENSGGVSVSTSGNGCDLAIDLRLSQPGRATGAIWESQAFCGGAAGNMAGVGR